MYECVIFDVDGTLVDTEKAIIGSLQRMLKVDFDRDVDEEELFVALGIPSEDGLLKLGIADIDKAIERWDFHMKDFSGYIKLFSGVEEVIKELNKIEIHTGIVTSRTNEEFQNDTALHKLVDYLHCVVCADDTLKHKPEPEPILKFLEVTNINPSRTIYIGDTIYDFKCAQSAGVDFGLALWGAKNTENIDAKYKFQEPREILEILSSTETV